MLSIDDLNPKLLAELRVIAEKNGIKDPSKFSKKELIAKILEKQSSTSDTPAEKSKSAQPSGKRPRKVAASGPDAPTEDAAAKGPSSESVEVVSQNTIDFFHPRSNDSFDKRGKRQRIHKNEKPFPDNSPQDAAPRFFDEP